MKVHIEIDLTPEEARAAMGLPDLAPVHDRFVAMMIETMEKGPRPELVEQMMRSWAPMGEAGMTFWRKMIEGPTKAG